MKKFKKLTIVMLTVAVLCTLVAVFAACGKKVSGISVEQSGMPQLTFVQGQELDFSGGKLTVTIDGKTQEIALNDPAISVSGYNKDEIGKQTVTISYKGQETTLEITVAAQVAAENYESQYFIGEAFNNSRGRVKITRNDGTTFNVSLTDEKLSLTGFDSSSEGTKTVTAKYESYEGTFPVEIFEATKATLRNPNKNAYQSHESEIDLAGGYLTLENGSLKKTIPLAESMVSGFDLSAATLENLETPLKQEITVNYAGTHKFTINVSYSAVSLMKQRAQELSSLDWSQSEPEITTTQGANAVDALQRFFNLSSLDQELISQAEQESVVRVAAVYAQKQWQTEIEAFEGVFELAKDDAGTTEARFLTGTLEQAQAAHEKLVQNDTPARQMTALLERIAENFASFTVVGENTIADYLGQVFNADVFDYVLSALEYGFELNDTLKVVPADWRNADIKTDAVKKALDDSLEYISTNNFKGSNYGDFSLYDLIGSWRGATAENDLMDLYYQHAFNFKNAQQLNVIKSIYLPDDVAEMYGYITICDNYLYQLSMMQSFDTSNFMWLYQEAVLSVQKNLQNHDNELIQWAYETIDYGGGTTFDAMVDELAASYAEHCGGMYENKKFVGLWSSYFEILARDAAGASYDDLVEDFLKAFIDAPESVQFGFLASMVPTFTSVEYAFPVLNYTDLLSKPENQLVSLTAVLAYYFDGANGVLPKDEGESSPRTLMTNLLGAVEDYIRRYEDVKEGYDNFSSFRIYMLGVQQNYEKLTDAHKSVVDEKLGYILNKYNAIAASYENFFEFDKTLSQKDPQIGDEFTKKFDELSALTWEIGSIAQNDPTSAGRLFAAYLKAEQIANDILESGDANVIEAYYHYEYNVAKVLGSTVVVPQTMDYCTYLNRTNFTDFLTRANMLTTYYEQIESDSAIKAFMIQAYEVYSMDYSKPENAERNAALVADLLAASRALTAEQRNLFYGLDIIPALYFNALLSDYFQTVLKTEAQAEFAFNTIGLEQLYTAWAVAPEAEKAAALEKLNTAKTAIKEEYTALSAEDKEGLPAYIVATYEYYTGNMQENA